MKEWQRNSIIVALFNIVPSVWVIALGSKNFLSFEDQIGIHVACVLCLLAACRLFYHGNKGAAFFALTPILLTTFYVWFLPGSLFPILPQGWGRKWPSDAAAEFYRFSIFVLIYSGVMLSLLFPVRSAQASWDDKALSAIDKSQTYAEASAALRDVTEQKSWNKFQLPSSTACFLILLTYFFVIKHWGTKMKVLQGILGTPYFNLMFFFGTGLAAMWLFMTGRRTQSFWIGAGAPLLTMILCIGREPLLQNLAAVILAAIFLLCLWQPELKGRHRLLVAILVFIVALNTAYDMSYPMLKILYKSAG